MVNPRQDLANALSEAGVKFPPSATTQQLRNLLQSGVGTGENASNSTLENVADSDSNNAVNNENAAAANMENDIITTQQLHNPLQSVVGVETNALNSTILFDCTAAAANNQKLLLQMTTPILLTPPLPLPPPPQTLPER
ncbi:uncharacterized protein LOC129244731 [Anastrepha obliqua]|uniref:uncharacterized protein LOC129244731 n=1 Tax=Anastrepha obliqua TaxID=95512 RepID=UPI0024091B96|nr:uncharacterized protein LOC129244731 [Anastrepha obliqua]